MLALFFNLVWRCVWIYKQPHPAGTWDQSPKGNGSPSLLCSFPSNVFFFFFSQKDLTVEEGRGDVMATGELNPSHFPARRAAKVVQHYLNTRYGSPYRLFGLEDVHSATAEVSWTSQLKSAHSSLSHLCCFLQDVADTGRRYHLQISAHEIISNVRISSFQNQV